MATRYKADLSVMEKPWGESFSYEEIKYEIETKKPSIFAIVHAETSSGVLQPLEGIGELCRKNNCLFLVDAVTSLGALELLIDEWKIDLAYSCSQKGLSCPPGLSPFTMNKRAEEKLSSRKTKVPNWYLDLSLLNKYWGSDRVYHHTAPVNMNFAIREGLRLIANEGLENVWNRHKTNAKKLWNGLEGLGMELHVSEDYRLPTLTTVKIPPAVDGDGFRNHLLRNFGIEIGNGLGELSGKVWRIGLMGFNSSEENVDRLLNLFDTELKKYSIFESSTF
jgi:alanine-glyoxylate transaminase/serine-glyoxylate transaminase/serine-pyruvate transaminase